MTAWRTNAEPFAADHPCLPGHFPGRPIVPGTLILQRVMDDLSTHHPQWRVASVVNAKFLSPLKPGEAFIIQVDLQDQDARFECRRDQATLASGHLKLTPRAASA